jgi:hypothetical protein
VSHTVPCCVVEAKRPSTLDHGVCQAILQVLDMQSRCAVASVSSPPVCPGPPPAPATPGGGPHGGSGGLDALCESLALVALDESLPTGVGDARPSATEASAGSLRGGPPASKLCARHGGQWFGMSFIHPSSLVSRACMVASGAVCFMFEPPPPLPLTSHPGLLVRQAPVRCKCTPPSCRMACGFSSSCCLEPPWQPRTRTLSRGVPLCPLLMWALLCHSRASSSCWHGLSPWVPRLLERSILVQCVMRLTLWAFSVLQWAGRGRGVGALAAISINGEATEHCCWTADLRSPSLVIVVPNLAWAQTSSVAKNHLHTLCLEGKLGAVQSYLRDHPGDLNRRDGDHREWSYLRSVPSCPLHPHSQPFP